MGEIEGEGVKISTRDKKKVSRISESKLGIEPEQIALGRDYYYVYGNRMLVKLNYNSDIVAKREIGRACRLTCRNGYLFIGTYEDKEDGPPDMVYAFYANRYLSESEFEKGKLKSCRADSSGKCLVAGITLYDHEGKYFSDNPCLPGYEGINYYNSIETDEQEKEAKTVRTTLVEDMLREKGLSNNRYMVCEYQKGDYLYGVVNIWEDVFFFSDKKLKESIAYRISCGEGKVEIIKELQGRYMVVATDDCVVYQEDKKLLKLNLSSGREEELATVSQPAYAEYFVQDDYIETEAGTRIQWNTVSA